MFFVCSCLRFAVQAVGDSEEIESLFGKGSIHQEAKCPECNKLLLRGPVLDVELHRQVHHVLRLLAPMEAHLALSGLGFPEEQACTFSDVQKVLVGQRIRSIEGSTLSDTTRTILDSITMEDGTTLMVAASPYGALVYRIRPPNPFVRKEQTE